MPHSRPAFVQESSFSSDTTLNDSDEEQQQCSDNAQNHDSHVWFSRHHDRRTLVLCFDGTDDKFDGDNSNVVQFVSMLKKNDPKQQLVYYQPGIGTYADPIIKIRFLRNIYRIVDDMLAISLSRHVKDGYAFLMQTYRAGDNICIFGFSRGAYTARALAGMLQKVGLLCPHNYQQIPFAYNMYKRDDMEGCKQSKYFKGTFCRDVRVDFVGVWDTVASVGLIPQYLPFVSEDDGIRCIRHALALDEHRVKFLPLFCVDPDLKNAAPLNETPLREDEGQVSVKDLTKTDVLEVWFAGVHTDVGGGSVTNGTPHALARIPLRWMIRQCIKCNTGIIFDAVMLQQIGLNVMPKGPDHLILDDVPPRIPGTSNNVVPADEPRSNFFSTLFSLLWSTLTTPFTCLAHWIYNRQPPRADSDMESPPYILKDSVDEAEEERKDALTEMHDQLKAAWWWFILEYFPLLIKKQRALIYEIDGVKAYSWIWNRARGRKIYTYEVERMKVHRSVKTRLEAGAIQGGVYVPRARPKIPGNARRSKSPTSLHHHEWNVDNPKHWEWVD